MNENPMTQKERTMKCGTLIYILLIAALVNMAFVALRTFFVFEEVGVSFVRFNMKSTSVMLMKIAPAVLFAIYSFCFYRKEKGNVLLPIAFGALIFYAVYAALGSFGDIIWVSAIKIVGFLQAMAFVPAMIYVLNGYKGKVLMILSMAMSVFLAFLRLVFQLLIYRIAYDVPLITLLRGGNLWLFVMGSVLLYAAMLVFFIANNPAKKTVPAVMADAPNEETV